MVVFMCFCMKNGKKTTEKDKRRIVGEKEMTGFVIEEFIRLLGGAALFLSGLNAIGGCMEKSAGKRTEKLLSSCSRSRFAGFLTGTAAAALCQSSAAAETALVGFVAAGVLTFESALPAVMGANVGTTVTAQIVSLAGGTADVGLFGSVLAFYGLIARFIKGRLRVSGEAAYGLGTMFVGAEILKGSAEAFRALPAFRSFFLCGNSLLLFFNGILATAVLQSSSAVTGVLVLFAQSGSVGFSQAVCFLLGSNVGTCFPVVLLSLSGEAAPRRVAWFNLVFNLIGAVAVLPFPLFFGRETEALFFTFASSLPRAIADFHTLFNLFFSLLALPFVRPLARLTEKLVKDGDAGKGKRGKKRSFRQIFTIKN